MCGFGVFLRDELFFRVGFVVFDVMLWLVSEVFKFLGIKIFFNGEGDLLIKFMNGGM